MKHIILGLVLLGCTTNSEPEASDRYVYTDTGLTVGYFEHKGNDCYVATLNITSVSISCNRRWGG